MLDELISAIPRATAACSYGQTVSIGGVSLALNGYFPDDVRFSTELQEFKVETGRVDIDVSVIWRSALRSWTGQATFDSGALWKVFSDDAELVFDFTSPALGIHPYKRLRTDHCFRSAEVILSREALGQHMPIFPLEYPADELLITNFLASGLGVEMHGCGLIDSEAGAQLFLGHSGDGKSTTTMLWRSLLNPEILSDDRIILRLHDGDLWMYGTPWHGEAAFGSPGKAKLNRIFVLQHGSQNQVRLLSRAHAAGELFARCFPPFHSPAGLEGTLQFLNRIVEAVPCYEFQFVPNSSAVRMAVEFNGKN